MGPKADPNQVVYLTLRVTGGEAPSGAAIAPKLGALGLVCTRPVAIIFFASSPNVQFALAQRSL